MLSNMLIVFLMGMAFERQRTAVALVGFFVMAAYLSIYVEMAFVTVDGTSRLVIGSSGATRALSGFVIVQYFPTEWQLLHLDSIRDWMLNERSFGGYAVVVPVVALYATALSVGQFMNVLEVAPNTAFLAHLTGSAFGVVLGTFSKVYG